MAGRGDFLRGRARSPTDEVVAFGEENRSRFGVEPICDALQFAASSYSPQGRVAPGTPPRAAGWAGLAGRRSGGARQRCTEPK